MAELYMKPTSKQKRLAELIVKGEKRLVDCYIEAYEQSGKQLINREALSARAYSASVSQGCKYWIAKLQEQEAVEEARGLVWDKRRASKRLLEMTNEVEANVKITRQLRDKMLSEGGNTSSQLSQMLKVAQICNDTARCIREIVNEMNNMYGLTNPEVSLTNAIQVIIGGIDKLPPDQDEVIDLRREYGKE